MNEIPQDDREMITEDIIDFLEEINTEKNIMFKVIGDMEESEPDFTYIIRQMARRHIKPIRDGMKKNPISILEHLCVKFAAIAWYATKKAQKTNFDNDFTKSLTMNDRDIFDESDDIITLDDLEDEELI
ncbi:MAG: hypothetical protein DRN27_08355 [Thermoplasmata archaeon]|nr:MAG: hypothetical protein DRN27_08355 [Thermoplasmata archaeon]